MLALWAPWVTGRDPDGTGVEVPEYSWAAADGAGAGGLERAVAGVGKAPDGVAVDVVEVLSPRGELRAERREGTTLARDMFGVHILEGEPLLNRLRLPLAGIALIALLGGGAIPVGASTLNPDGVSGSPEAAATPASQPTSPLHPRDLHNDAVIAQRSPGDDTNNVFSSYSPSGASSWATNWTAGLDLTGVGWNSNQAGTLISPQHVVMADHYPVGVGGTIVFTDHDGNPHSRTLTGSQTVRISGYDSDIRVGVLNQPIFDVSYYRVMAPHTQDDADQVNGFGSYEQLMSNALIISTNHAREAFLLRSSVTPGTSTKVSHSRANTVRGTGGLVDLNPAWTRSLISGDSGHPSFFPHDGELLLMGTHYTTEKFPYVASPEGQASINATMAALGGGPYQLETVEARPHVQLAPGETPCDSSFLHGFTDVLPSKSHAGAITWLVAAGITSGTGRCSFSPGASVTRGQMATFLWRNAGGPEPTGTHNFDDVTPDRYYNTAVTWLVESGITKGTKLGKFSPNDQVSRGQMATFLWRYAGEPAATRPHNFDDVTPDRYYDTPVAWLAGQFFISGTGPGTYSPNRSITRNETAVLLWLVEGHPTP